MATLLTPGPERLVVESQVSGSWRLVGVWLAAALNSLDRSVRRGSIDRTARASILDAHVSAARGDHREIDLITLPDGTRVCWHIARRGPRWFVEERAERCATSAMAYRVRADR